MYEPPYSFDFSPAPNRAVALSYRFGYACWVALLIWPLTLMAVMMLSVVLDAHDTPRGGVIVLEVATAAVALPGVGGVVLAIAGGAALFAWGRVGRRAISSVLRAALMSSPGVVFAWLYAQSVCWI